MFEHLAAFGRVIVTGPQRSGTTITARMIEHDTGLEYVDEQEFEAIREGRWRRLVESWRGFVMQAPGMCRFVHEYGHEPDVCIVLVRRPIEDIIASQERIGWTWEPFELARYGLPPDAGPIAAVKYGYFDRHQRQAIDHLEEVCYNDLEAHPLWIAPGERGGFSSRQWTFDNA